MNERLKRDLVYALLTVLGMVPIMLTYNVLLEVGFNAEAAVTILKQIGPLFIVAFIVQRFVVSRGVFAAYKALVAPTDPPLKHNIVMTLLWVTSMCVIMSFYATVVHIGPHSDLWHHWVTGMLRNYPVALIAQAFIVGPLVRNTHQQIFPAVSPVSQA